MSADAPPSPVDYQAFFDGSSELLFVMRAQGEFPIVAANESFLRGTMTQRDRVLGRGLFEAFPATPGTETDNSKRDVLAMLERIRRTQRSETTPPYRYDLPRPAAEGGGLEERHWQMNLTPVELDAQGVPQFVLGRTVDITAQVFADREIKDARSRLEATLASAEIGTWIWNVRENQVFADRNLARLFNVSSQTAEGGAIELYMAAMHPDDRGETQAAIAKSTAEGGQFEVEYRLRRPDGTYRWVAARGWAERDLATGEVTRFPGVVLDISARRQAQEAAEAAAEHLRLAVQATDLGTWEYLPTTNTLTWSDECRAMFGLLPGVPVSYEESFLGGLHPDDRVQTHQAVQQALNPAGGGAYSADFRTISPSDGTERWVAARGKALFDEQGQCRRFIGTVLDITERKRAQQAAERRSAQLQRLAETSARINTTLDVRSVLGVITAEARGLIGARHAVTTAAPVGTLQEGAQPLTVASHAEETSLLGLDNVTQSTALAVPLVAQGGNQLGVIELTSKEAGGFTPDDTAVLTQLAQIAARAIENARLYEELRANDKRKDEFLAMLAHELRNPLSAIRNAVALGSDTEDSSDVTWAMEVIQRQVRQLSRLIDDLLDVSRITQGMVQLRREKLDVAGVFARAADTVGGVLRERGHQLTINAPAETYFVDADATRLEQVLGNLLTNAAKYTDKGGEITLSAAVEGNEVVISIKDNGMGIPPDKVPQMFELFAQGNRTLARSEGGLGIGLTVVRSLVELHGGSVSARSDGPGRGSEFFVRLPMVKTEAPAKVVGTAPMVSSEEKKGRVLVVDDNEDSARAVARIISRQGYDVKVAYDGPSAVEIALEHQPEFVFLDIGLPGLNGYDVATRLRQDEGLKNSLLVAVSGYGEESDRRRSREAGFDQHLVKPVDPGTLLALMKE